MRELFHRRRVWLEAFGWALCVIGVLSFANFLWEGVTRDGGAAYDLHAYLLAGRNLLDGAPLYPPMEINDPGAYRYPPTFALMAVPLAPIPEPIVTWAYRALCLGCLRILVGSWRAVGWSFLFLPVQIELIALNVTLPIAATARLSLRGPIDRVASAAIPATAALKVGTGLPLPYLWVTRAPLRRPIAIGAALLLAAFAVHALMDPGVWRDYVASLGQQAISANDAPFVGDQLLFLVPSTLADFGVRLALGALLIGLGFRLRADWLAFTAAAIAVPTLWVARFAALAGVPRLVLEDAHRANAPEER
jgi:hypothetical protein